jgi:RHS repeat-associated protein
LKRKNRFSNERKKYVLQLKFTIFETSHQTKKMGCLKLTYNENNDTLKVAYSSCKENQKYCTGAYRYGFNGKEKDDEINGSGNDYDFGARIYDSRLGRWLSLDPLQEKYAGLSPYNFCGNNPIMLIDPDGKKIINYLTQIKEYAVLRLTNAQKALDEVDENSITKKELKLIKREIRAATKNLNIVTELHKKVQDNIDLVKNVDPELYNQIDNLTTKEGTPIDVYITASTAIKTTTDKNGVVGTTRATTSFNWTATKDKDGNTKYSIDGNKFAITLYGNSTESSIANEFGDVLFATQNPEKSYKEGGSNLNDIVGGYMQQEASKSSFGVQHNFEKKLETYKKNNKSKTKNEK